MAANRRRGRRTAAIATAVAAVVLTAGLVTGCDDVEDSLDCLRNADAIAESLKTIHDAGLDAARDPGRTDESIHTIEENLEKIGDQTGNDKVDKAVDDLGKAVADYNEAIVNGDTNPDSGKINDAADDLVKVCSG